jgi:hypothetical protein
MGTANKWVAGLLIGCLSLTACSVAKQDQRAFDRVTAKRPLIDKILPIVQDLYPCVSDTVTLLTPGGIDSIPYPVEVIETVHEFTDTGYARGFIDGQKTVAKRKFAKPRPDTLKITIVDRRALQIASQEISELRAQIAPKDVAIAERDKRINTLNWILILAVLLLAITNTFWLTRKS